jgi:hypothetical protein
MVSRNMPKHKAKLPITYAEAARRLGVTKPHLWLVLNKQRVSERLSRRYAELLTTLNTATE